MGVRIKFVQTKPGIPAVTRVQDNFGRSTLNPAAGPILWSPMDQIITPWNSPTAISDVTCDGLGNLIISGFGTNNPNSVPPVFMPCLGFTFSLVNGKTQYCQVKFNGVANAGVGGDVGPAVFISTNGQAGGTCYMCTINNGSQLTVSRVTVSGGALSEVHLSGVAFASVSVGDVLRLACQAGSPNTVTLKKNGSQIFSGTDAGLSTGVPGFCNEVCGVVAGNSPQFKFQNFDGGIGT